MIKFFKKTAKLWAVLGLMLLAGGMPGLSPVCAAGKTPSLVVQKQAEADLNGSGKTEKITFTVDAKAHKFTLTVAGSSQSVGYDDEPPAGFSVVAIDKAAKHRELVVACPGASDATSYFIFSYEGNTLHKIGEVSRSVEFPGDGSVLVQDWSGFWSTHDRYVLEGPTHTLKKVPQEFYYVGKPATVKKAFPIYTSPSKQTVVANVKSGSKVTLLLCDNPFKEDAKWYLLKTQDNLIGWVKEDVIQEHLDGLSWAG